MRMARARSAHAPLGRCVAQAAPRVGAARGRTGARAALLLALGGALSGCIGALPTEGPLPVEADAAQGRLDASAAPDASLEPDAWATPDAWVTLDAASALDAQPQDALDAAVLDADAQVEWGVEVPEPEDSGPAVDVRDPEDSSVRGLTECPEGTTAVQGEPLCLWIDTQLSAGDEEDDRCEVPPPEGSSAAPRIVGRPAVLNTWARWRLALELVEEDGPYDGASECWSWSQSDWVRCPDNRPIRLYWVCAHRPDDQLDEWRWCDGTRVEAIPDPYGGAPIQPWQLNEPNDGVIVGNHGGSGPDHDQPGHREEACAELARWTRTALNDTLCSQKRRSICALALTEP